MNRLDRSSWYIFDSHSALCFIDCILLYRKEEPHKLMNHSEREQRRVTFDATAADYDAVRPGYPVGMYEDLVTFTRLPAAARILEIGCGSGQATLPLAKLGYQVTAIDISPELTVLARKKLASFKRVQIATTSFEDFVEEQDGFDLVIAATAMHWVDPALRFYKSALLLKDGGVIAIIRNTHPRPLTGFFKDTSPIYHRLVPEWHDRNRTHADPGSEILTELEQSELFEQITDFKYQWTVNFTRDEYLRLLHTFSDHLRLGKERLNQVCDTIGELIDSHYGGVIERPYLTEMLLASKRSV